MGSGPSTVEDGGFRVFKVHDGGPAAEAGLEVLFDFITEINDSKLSGNQTIFFKKIQDSENKRTKLKVINTRSRESRDVFVTPRQWSGIGLLGAVVRFDLLPSDADKDQGLRVLDVFSNSPAAEAGLIPLKDFILGTTEVMFQDAEDVSKFVNTNLGKNVKIYVYNSDSETVREVSIAPKLGWGGPGGFGADISTGVLHRIPAPRQHLSGTAQVASLSQAVEQSSPHDLAATVSSSLGQPLLQAQQHSTPQEMPSSAMLHGLALQSQSTTVTPSPGQLVGALPPLAQASISFMAQPTGGSDGTLPNAQMVASAHQGLPSQPSVAVPLVHAPLLGSTTAEEASIQVQLEIARRQLAAMEAAVAASAVQQQTQAISLAAQQTAVPSQHPSAVPQSGNAESTQAVLATAPSSQDNYTRVETSIPPYATTAALMLNTSAVVASKASLPPAVAPMTAPSMLTLEEALTPGVIYEIPAM